MTGDVRGDTLIVIRKGEIKPGATEFGSIAVVVPKRPQNGRARGSGRLSSRPHR
jgi:hypothetical protein